MLEPVVVESVTLGEFTGTGRLPSGLRAVGSSLLDKTSAPHAVDCGGLVLSGGSRHIKRVIGESGRVKGAATNESAPDPPHK